MWLECGSVAEHLPSLHKALGSGIQECGRIKPKKQEDVTHEMVPKVRALRPEGTRADEGTE